MGCEQIARLPAGYQALFERVRSRLGSDDRVRAMWLGGSIARRVADAASDLDVIVTVADSAREGFAAEWRPWLADITPTVLARPLPFAAGSFTSITPAFERLDVVVESVSEVSDTFFRDRAVVFDHDDLQASLPAPGPARGPSPDLVRGLIEEFFRISAIETIVVRDDWLLAREHLHILGSLLYQLFVEANAPLPMMGVKQWSAKLTEPQQRVLASMPSDAQALGELRAAHLALASAFVTNAERLADQLDAGWPTDLEAAAAEHVGAWLDLDDPYPRTGEPVV